MPRRRRSVWLAGAEPGRRGRLRIDDDHPVVVVGAGLAGLACALRLAADGIPYRLIDQSDAVGGRLRTDVVDGFLLDRGFQVLLTAYPEAAEVLDYDELALCEFTPGAVVWLDHGGGRLVTVSDPRRRPLDVVATLRAPVGSLFDKALVTALQARLATAPPERLLARGPDVTTRRWLDDLGFSDAIVERLWRPLLAGIQLDPTLSTSSRAAAFVIAMLARGANTVPSAGIQAVPAQLVERLDPERVGLGRRIARVAPDRVVDADGGEMAAGAVVVAVDGPTASTLLDGLDDPGSSSVGCVWLAAERPPIDQPAIVLDGARSGPVNNLSLHSVVNPACAPTGAALLGASVVGDDLAASDDDLLRDVRAQMRRWFGPDVDGWTHLRTDRIAHAQPRQPAGSLTPPQRPVRVAPGLYVAGDHRDDASINGALVSGRRAAEAVVADVV